jgi:hypothetical protein
MMGMKHPVQHYTCTSIIDSQDPCQARCDRFWASTIFPKHVTTHFSLFKLKSVLEE